MSVINTNVKALAAQGSLSNVNKALGTSMERLSTGLRINSAADDAAGLAITNRMTSQIRGYAVAIRNSNDGISMAQTAEGAMGQVTSMLQRMRELSVQAANGAMSDADRGNIQQEVSQLKAQIDDVAIKTNHNNINLLDGSAGKIVLQTGTNAGDTMTIGFGSVKTKDIGLGSRASLTASAVTSTALATGDLLINGVEVGSSLATDDKLSFTANEGSAIAKAAAINRVSDLTGVKATVGETTAYGSTMTAAATNGKFTINGVETATIYTTTDSEISRSAVMAAINQISDQTGVKAINTHDDNQGVVLVAADGRNITVKLATTLTAASTGVNATSTAATTAGTYSLNTDDGSSITVSSKIGGDLSKAGLSAGTFKADTAQTVSTARTSAAAAEAPSTTTTGVLNGNTLIINDVQIDAAIATDDAASDTLAASGTKAASAIAIAAAINKKSTLTGVTAKAEANVITGSGFTAAAVTNIYLNGVTISANFTANTTRAEVIEKFNTYSGQTGVVASAGEGTGITLTAADGRNISIGAGGVAASIGLEGATVGTTAAAASATTTYAKVSLSSDKAFDVKSGSEGNTNFAKLGFRAGTFGGADNGQKIATVDVSTSSGATNAIKAIDAALDTVAGMEAKAGAYQNRLDAVVSNLTESNQNMSASRSRILDTDYATETTAMARSQIVAQAATAMLAQANQSAQSVLSLLK